MVRSIVRGTGDFQQIPRSPQPAPARWPLADCAPLRLARVCRYR